MSLTPQQVLSHLASVYDPELTVSITDLGIVRQVDIADRLITIELIPTFLGCPALNFIKQDAYNTLCRVYPEMTIVVEWNLDQKWSPENITPDGRAALKNLGISVPSVGDVISCPYCGESFAVTKENEFGSSLCRALFYCNSCHNTFDLMKHKPNRSALT
jgi:ring-1,2-phenylacetyl-CoA epoxidase subunit PaaD